jgi:sialic acid synthase SpsE
VRLLHCTSEYPTPFEEVNLKNLKTLRQAFGLPVGLSDHTPGYSIPLAAVALGATVIEKHFTLDKKMDGPDHRASLDPTELSEMIRGIRQIEVAMGLAIKAPTPSELKNKLVARKSLVAKEKIKKGQKFSVANLTVKRPGTGLAPENFWPLLGTISPKDFDEDEVIKL